MTHTVAKAAPVPDEEKTSRQGFWRGLARRIDALAAYSRRHAVSELELCRADEEIRRCRQAMMKTPGNRGEEILACVPLHHAVPSVRLR